MEKTVILNEPIGYYDRNGKTINNVPANTKIIVLVEYPQYEFVIGLLPDGTEGIIPNRYITVMLDE